MRLWAWERRKDDLAEELDAHLRMAIADRVARGESPEEARAAAVREMGNPPLVADVTRRQWGWEWLERIMARRALCVAAVAQEPRIHRNRAADADAGCGREHRRLRALLCAAAAQPAGGAAGPDRAGRTAAYCSGRSGRRAQLQQYPTGITTPSKKRKPSSAACAAGRKVA